MADSETGVDRIRELKRKDKIDVEKDGERLPVFNWANIQVHRQIRLGESERTSVFVNAGDASWPPDYITTWLADELEDEFNVNVPGDTHHEIEVIDPTDEEVTVL